MKVLLVGLGTVGEAIARMSVGRPWLELMVLADHDLDRARRIAEEIGDDSTHPFAQVDASDEHAVEALARAHGVDLVLGDPPPERQSFHRRPVVTIASGRQRLGGDPVDVVGRGAGQNRRL